MPNTMRRQPQELPQLEETWHAFVFKMRTWITEPGKKPVRPQALMILNLTTGMMMGLDMVETITPDWVSETVFKAITRPGKGMKPHRPQAITLPNAELVTTLTPRLSEIGVACRQMDTPEELYQIVRELESHLRKGEPEIPGLLSVEGVTPEFVGELFAAATEFYHAAPWVQLTNTQGLAVRLSTQAEPRYVSVMGNAGIEYGLSVSQTWEDFARMASGAVDDAFEAIPASGGHSFLFNEVTHVPFDDLDAMEQYHWQVPDENAFPVPIVFNRSANVTRPDRAELLWYQAALRAISIFVREHLHSNGRGDYEPAEASIAVSTSDGEVAVVMRYPAGKLDIAAEPATPMDWHDEDEGEDAMPVFDRRSMEGQMAAMTSQIDGESFHTDPKLHEAQELMYQAWETQNPGRRITLAHKALTISPDCADAYVLLAEEEADTVARALELYQQGVAAGERSLGEHFQELAGNFWGVLETRPYMRARQGLADTLWRLGRREEALHHYEEMLRLNPNDNQGLRYLLADLLLQMDRDADLEKLLNQYRGDWSAHWHYTRALVEFRKRSAAPSDKANKALQRALRQNPHVPPYLTGEKRLPKSKPDYVGMGDENEAIAYAADHLNHWRRTHGAVDWLKEQLAAKTAAPSVKKSREPSRDDLIEAVLAGVNGPMPADELVSQVLAHKPSKAKDPVKSLKAYLREPYGRKPYVLLDRDTVLPVRLALQGVHFRITLDRQMASSGTMPLYPYFYPFLRGLQVYGESAATPMFENDQGHEIPSDLTKLRVKTEEFLGGPTHADIQAVDLKGWLNSVHARRGDSLLLTVLDWQAGRFQLTYEPERRRRKNEIAQQNRALADLLYELLEATYDERLWTERGLVTAYARLPSARGYPGDHWMTVLEKDERMRWEEFEIVHAESERLSLFDMFAEEPEEEAVEEKPFTAQQGRQVYRFRASRGKKELLIEAQGTNTLGDLDAVMRDAFRLDTWDHLSEFTLVTPRGRGKQPRLKHFGALDPAGEYAAHRVHLAGLGLEPGAQIEYIYDFGDNVEHALVLEVIEEPEKGVEYPRFRKVSGGKRK